MKRTLAISGVAIIIVAAIVVAVFLVRKDDSGAAATTVPPVVQADAIVADGTVLPTIRAELSFTVAGRVSSVLVEPGEVVAEGAPLVGLVDTSAQAALAATQGEVAAAEAVVKQTLAAIGAAQAAIDKAQAARDGVSDGAADWRIDAADADVALAQAQLEVARADNEAAQARFNAAEAKLRQTQAALDELTLKAPFAGTVMSVDVRTGDLVGPAMIAVRVADLSAWEIVTTDLDESSLARLSEGAVAEITFDALRGVIASGRVTEIGLVGRSYQGMTVYPVTVVPDGVIEGLRWGLTATVRVPLE